MRGAVITGAVAAIVVVAAVAGAGWYLSRGKVPIGEVTQADTVVVMLTGPAEDGATVAQLIAVADVSGSTLEVTDVDPATRVSIPGTSYDLLRDAYPFGGGPAVAEALTRIRGGKALPYLVIPSDMWSTEPSGSASVDVTLPRSVDVFDGTRLTTFASGGVRVAPADLPALLQGLGYLGAADRVKVRSSIADSFIRAMGTIPVQPGRVQTDLSADALAAFLQAVETRSR
jgi:hypothetical protein